jgi:hypothetical protein
VRLDLTGGFWLLFRIQVRRDQLTGARPLCSRGCSGTVHCHGHYLRYADPEGSCQERIDRFLCHPCGLTISVLSPHRLPYRAVRAERLQADFDCRAGIQTQGLDPPPRVVEAGCLQRAWSSLSARVNTLKDAFGQLVCSTVSEVASLWAGLRMSQDSVPRMLCFLSEHHHISLLGNYLCLRLPP